MQRILLYSCAALLACAPARAQWELDVETGRVSCGYNDVRIPGAGGTRFSLSEELAIDPSAFLRFRIGRTWGRHTLTALAAPLRLEAAGIFDKPVSFMGETFPGAVPVTGTFRFDSYRLTYRYALARGERFDAGIGFTAKIRDAEIGLDSGVLSARKTNVGFVPILDFRLAWKPVQRLHLLFEGDALAAPQGRAEDVFAGLLFGLRDGLRLKAGYRLLEGGADNDEVYNFALLHYLSAGLLWNP
jgi:hypothetical protein